jgi:hypothetical protein
MKQELGSFLGELGLAKASDFNESDRLALHDKYKSLVKKAKIGGTDTKNLNDLEKRACEVLELNPSAFDVSDELVKEIHTNNHSSVERVVTFIKSRRGFELINSTKSFDKFSDEELVELFGSLFGVSLAKECVQSLKAEKVGRVVGYALSGLFEQHKHLFEQNVDNTLQPDVRQTAFGRFLKEKIQESDWTCVYEYEESADHLKVDCSIYEQGASENEVRGRNRPDHCFVNHQTKTIVVGQSTSNKDVSKQRYSFFKAERALREMVNREGHGLFGYKVQPFMLLSGRFTTDQAQEYGSQEVGKAIKSNFPHASEDELNILARFQYIRLFGNAKNEEHVQSLLKYNPFIAGVDTLELYEDTRQLQEAPTQETLKWLLSHIQSTVNLLAEGDLSMTTGRSDMLLYLNDVHVSINQLFSTFHQEIDKTFFDGHVKPLADEVTRLCERLESVRGVPAVNSEVEGLWDVKERIDSLEAYNKRIKRVKTPETPQLEWSGGEPFVGKYQDSYSKRKNVQIGINKLPQALVELASVIKGAGTNRADSSNDRFFNEYVSQLEKMFLGTNWDKSNLSPTFRTNLSNKLNDSWVGDAISPLKKEFIEKTRFLFDGRLTQENRQDKTASLINHLNKGFYLGHDRLFERTKTYQEAEALAKTFGEEISELEVKCSVLMAEKDSIRFKR